MSEHPWEYLKTDNRTFLQNAEFSMATKVREKRSGRSKADIRQAGTSDQGPACTVERQDGAAASAAVRDS